MRNQESKKRYTTISFEVTKRYRQALNDYCRQRGLSRSEVIRTALRTYLKDVEG